MIPKILHIVWLGPQADYPAACIDSWRTAHPGWQLKVWGESELLGRRWVNLKHMVAMAQHDPLGVVDMMRYEIVFQEGGFAVDARGICVQPLPDSILDASAFCCWENEIVSPGRLSNHYFAAEARNPLLARVIQDIGRQITVVDRPARETTGARRLTDSWRACGYNSLTVYPAHYFMPQQLPGMIDDGRGPVFSRFIRISGAQTPEVQEPDAAARNAPLSGAAPGAAHEMPAVTAAQAERLTDRDQEPGRIQVLERGAGPVVNTLSFPAPAQAGTDGPLVSCLMVSRGDMFPARLAVECFLRQSYRQRELVIVTASQAVELEAWIQSLRHPGIRFMRAPAAPLGELRNRSVAEARGDLLCIWDDDDLYDPERIARQYAAMAGADAAASFLARLSIWWPGREIMAASEQRPWENSMLVRRDVLPTYPGLARSEDAPVMQKIFAEQRIVILDRPDLYCYIVHGANTWHEAHFERFIGRATHQYQGAALEAAWDGLAARLPLYEYAVGLACRDLG